MRNRGANKVRPSGASHCTSGSALPTGGTRCVPPSALGVFLPRGTLTRGTGCSNPAYPFPLQFTTTKKMQPHTRLHLLVGPAGFEPTDGGVKVLCLTAWRRPIMKKDRAATSFYSLFSLLSAYFVLIQGFCHLFGHSICPFQALKCQFVKKSFA